MPNTRPQIRPPTLRTGESATASRLELFFDLAYVLVVLELADAFQAVGELGARAAGDPQPRGELDGTERWVGVEQVRHRGVVERAQPQPGGQRLVELVLGLLQRPRRPGHLRCGDPAPLAVLRSLRHGGIVAIK